MAAFFARKGKFMRVWPAFLPWRQLRQRRDEAGTFFHFEFAADEFFNLTKIFFLIAADERNRVAFGFGPAGTADAMDIVLGKNGNIEIYDVRNSLDIYSASGDICGDHNLEFTAFKTFHRLTALALSAVGVYRDRFNIVTMEPMTDSVGAVLCTRKNKYAVHPALFEHIQQDFHLLFPADGIDMLRNGFDGVSLLTDLDYFRMNHYSGGEGLYFGRYSSGKEQRLTFLGYSGDDFPHIVDKAHIEHTVGLVENEHFHVPQVDASPAHMVEQSARRSDNDIDAAIEDGKLTPDTYAAVNGNGSHMKESAVADNALFDLQGKFARWSKDESFYMFVSGRVFVAEPV